MIMSDMRVMERRTGQGSTGEGVEGEIRSRGTSRPRKRRENKRPPVISLAKPRHKEEKLFLSYLGSETRNR